MSVESLPVQNLVVAGSLAASFTGSLVAGVADALGFSVQVVWSGGTSPVGTFKLEASNDGTNFSDITSATAVVGSDTGNAIINVSGAYYNYVRLSYTKTSGTATTVNAKLYKKA